MKSGRFAKQRPFSILSQLAFSTPLAMNSTNMVKWTRVSLWAARHGVVNWETH